jgi:predicted nucleotidyltransferase
MDPGALLRSRFPNALGGVLAGSTARGEATASSDIDLVVLLPGPPAPMRRTERVDGQLVEFFIHTEDSFHAFVERERVQRRSPLLHMVAHGRIVGERDGRAARVQEAARALWNAGPAVLTHAEIEDRRYRLTPGCPRCCCPARHRRPRAGLARPLDRNRTLADAQTA